MTTDPFTVETVAAVQALDFTLNMDFREIEVEADALLILKKLQTMEIDLSPIGTIVDEARSEGAKFTTCIFMHTKRIGNVEAHTLAKHDLGFHEEIFW
ncbi:hypothetical protein CRYUN_Cryun14cG0079900 [Craigia yunnanensis]